MAKLKGTEKQIKWADDIKTEMLNLLEEGYRLTLKANETKGKDSTKTIARYEKIKTEIESIEEAKFFIENFKSLTQYNYTSLKAGYLKDFCNNNEIFKGMSNFMQRVQNEKRGE